MSTPLLICDDSGFARKQLARALPENLDASVSFAGNGIEAVDAVKSGKAEVMFLDLNMPEMDGYEVLEAIRQNGLQSKVIVVSGDIQPEAHARVMALGALEFIKKPVSNDQVISILTKYGITGITEKAVKHDNFEIDVWDGFQEVANVAMGRAADLLARLLNAFIEMPIPNVNMFEKVDLQMALQEIDSKESISAVCQGFIGSGVAGEALVVFTESSLTDIAELMHYEGEVDDTVALELIMDIACILTGSTLKGIADQLDLTFSQGHPMVLGRHVNIGDLLKNNTNHWDRTLAIELHIKIENRDINCDLLLLFTEDSLPSLTERVSYIAE